MKIFEVVTVHGETRIVFAPDRATVFARHPDAWIVNDVNIIH